MTSFKDLFDKSLHFNEIFVPTVSLGLSHGQSLHLKFDHLDVVTDASYSGKVHPWFSALCEVIRGQDLQKLIQFSQKNYDEYFKDDVSYWEHRQECEDDLYASEIELLHATLDHYRGRDDLYTESSALICRCFGVRENDILRFLKDEKDPTLEKLAAKTKASLGCRSCLPQLKRWLLIEKESPRERFYKEKAIAEWLLEIDYILSCFPLAAEWGMEVQSFSQKQVTISFKKDVTQRELEDTGGELQRFLGAGVDEGLSFFLRRA